MLFDEGLVYFSGQLMAGLDVDWDDLAWKIDMLANGVRGLRFVPQRAVLDEDGSVYWMEFFGRDSMDARNYRTPSAVVRMPDGSRTTPEERKAKAIADLGGEFEDWLGYPLEMDFVTSDISDPRVADVIRRMRDSGTRKSFLEPVKRIEKSDICPKAVDDSDPFEELDALIGLDEVKQQVRKIVTMLEKSDRESLPVLHAAFLGNPGTGKTTVARLIAKIYDEMGVTEGKGNFVEAAREDLVGIFVGQTAPKTKQTIESARGGTLFIDEAYSLGIYGEVSSKDYGSEAIATLVKEMENHRNDPIVIMAGYTEPMNKMIDINPGMRDRIGFYFNFPDYSAEELCAVFEKFARDDGYELSPAAFEYVSDAFERIVENKDDNFANGRIARKVYERVRMNHLVSSGSGDAMLRLEDFVASFEDEDLAELVGGGNRREITIGFA